MLKQGLIILSGQSVHLNSLSFLASNVKEIFCRNLIQSKTNNIQYGGVHVWLNDWGLSDFMIVLMVTAAHLALKYHYSIMEIELLRLNLSNMKKRVICCCILFYKKKCCLCFVKQQYKNEGKKIKCKFFFYLIFKCVSKAYPKFLTLSSFYKQNIINWTAKLHLMLALPI